MSRDRIFPRPAVIAATSCVLVLTLAGCGRAGNAGSEETDAVSDGAAVGTIRLWASGADGQELPELFAAFEAENPDVDIEITEIPTDGFTSKLTAAISSGTVPDMVYLNTQSQAAMFATGGFAQVPDGLVSEDDFFPSLSEAAMYGDASYAVPWYAFANVFQFRSDLAADAGVAAPETWEEWPDFADALAKTGVDQPIGFAVTYDRFTAQDLGVLAAQNGGGLLSDDRKTWTIDTPENVEALEYWASFFRHGHASPDGPTFLDQVPMLSSGDLGALSTGPWYSGWLDDANGAGWSDEHLGIAAVPAGTDGNATSIGGGSLSVLREAQNPDAAWKLIRWMAEPQTQADWYAIFGNLPASESAWDLLDSVPELDVQREALRTGILPPQVSTWEQVGKLIGAEMEDVARGGTNAADALARAQQQADAIGTGTGVE
jgi:multiple sugar transport system substrate-binding protein